MVDPFIWNFKFFGTALVIATALGVVLKWSTLIAICGIFAMTFLFTFFLFAHAIVAICVRLAEASGDSYPVISLLAKTPQLAATAIRGILLLLCFWSADIYVALLRADFGVLAAAITSNVLLSGVSIAVTLIGVSADSDTGLCRLAKKALSIGGYLSFAVSSSLLAVAVKDTALLAGAQTLLDHPLWFSNPALVPVIKAFFATKTGIWLHALVVVPAIPLIFILILGAVGTDRPKILAKSPQSGIRTEARHLSTALTLYFAWLLCSYLFATDLL